MICPIWEQDLPAGQLARRRHAADLAKVIRAVKASAKRKIIASEEIKRWHRVTFESWVPLDYYAGNFRCDDKTMPCLGVNVEVGGISGCDFRITASKMEALFEAVNNQVRSLEIRWPSLDPQNRVRMLSAAVAQLVGEFIRIHPFVNGNGRMSRILWTWAFERYGVPAIFRIAPRPKPPYSEIMRQAMLRNLGPLTVAIISRLAGHAPRLDEPS